MSQHLTLGFKLRDRYDGFVSPRYVANEVYIRSTDVNRTLISAVSNLLGFYQTVNATPNEDYPTVPGWPRGYVPVPIHTVPEHWDPVVSFLIELRARKDKNCSIICFAFFKNF